MEVSHVLLLIIFLLNGSTETQSSSSSWRSFHIVNNCNYTIWPGFHTFNVSPEYLPTKGLTLKSGASFNLPVPDTWHSQVWARTLCSNDSSSGNFSCFTADCGTGKIECGASYPEQPVTLAYFALNANPAGEDLYVVSLVGGFNLPMVVGPLGDVSSSNSCISLGCSADLNGQCPKELRVLAEAREGSTVACMTPCKAFKNDLFCCQGNYPTPEMCGGTVYSNYFKQRCPNAYAFAEDDNQTTYVCSSVDYNIVFCPISLNQAPPPAKEATISQRVPSSKSENHKNIIIASVTSSVGIIIFIVAAFWGAKRKGQQEDKNSLLELEDGRRFMYSELVKITDNFASLIGAGGFGKVYHGALENDIQVAVKLLESASGSTEFQNEVEYSCQSPKLVGHTQN